MAHAMGFSTVFLSTPSARRATERAEKIMLAVVDFYPRPPRGGRRARYEITFNEDEFLSTPSARRATLCIAASASSRLYFYPRPPRGGRLRHCHRSGQGGGISIHALREEGDPFGYRRVKLKNDFYPRPPRGGRLYLRKSRSDLEAISIHALREEGDKVSRVPSWTSTISIHALREEGDRMGCERVHRRTDFYPRPPRGGRPKPTRNDMHPTIFLSTPSARRATYAPCIFRPCRRFLSTPSARRATQLS